MYIYIERVYAIYTQNHPVPDRKHPVRDTISEEPVPSKRLYHSIRWLHWPLILINNNN